MRKTIVIFFIILVNLTFKNELFGQNKLEYKTYGQNHLERNKIFSDVFHLRWYKNNWLPQAKDTLPYFVDDRNYKGIINYGVTFRRKDNKNFYFLENNYMCFLKVEFTRCDYNPKDSILKVDGFISGGWSGKLKKNEAQNNIDIFLGQIKDTVRACYFGNALYDKIMNKEKIESKLNNEYIDEYKVLDTFPSFYFKNYSYYRTISEGRRPFSIKGKVSEKTILAFGARGCYSEIFDLGSMIYNPNKNKLSKSKSTENLDCKQLIIDNKLIDDIEKEKARKLEVNYYSYTEKAEHYILAKQYAKAKEQYSLLYQNYPLVFARDIHNAIRCAILSRDIKMAFWWSEKFALKGVGLSYFNSKIFTGLRKNPEWKKFSVKYDSIYQLAQNKRNLTLKNELMILVQKDQLDYGLANRKDSKILYETTEKVTAELIDLLKREGFPSEERVGCYLKNDTILINSPDYNVLIRHAIQQKPKNFEVLNKLLVKSSTAFEYDDKRSPNNVMAHNSCFHIYKGNLYNSKSCGNNVLEVRKISFKFNNPFGFIMDYGNFIISEYNKENPEEWDDYYKENFNFIMKLTDNWEFYEN